ncbi:DUF3800 domain-containing protein [uncultured Shimia sp.]|uniref:DUF3800 domain-containing protein n=1 Tax=uncultured Shimia sp. TaxID=573152 RepID=UPI002621A9EC|nr:DUF3800 domain-containing protein [uncultured Shimia sp.]
MGYTVLIDESGEAGIAKVRTETTGGSSPYFVLAAVVFPEEELKTALETLDYVNKVIPKKKWSHATDLNHAQTVFWSREAAKLNCRMFAVVSNKETLGDYSIMIKNNPDKFYNKCTVYLLEKVGKYLIGKGLDHHIPNVIFERRNHKYDALRRYVVSIKDNPLHEEAKNLRVFNPFAFFEKGKDEEPLLKFADLAAHATYQCTNKTRTNMNIPEPRYFTELHKRFGADRYGKIIENGLKCIHSIDDLKLDEDVKEQLETLRAFPLRRG